MDADRRALNACILAATGILAVEALAALAVARAGLPAPAAIGLARAADLALIALGMRVFGLGRGEIFLPAGGLARGLRRGLLWSAAFGAAAALGFAAALLLGADPLRLIRPPEAVRGPEAVLFFAVGGLIGPLAEEVFFRGLLYRSLRPWGMPAAVLGTTLLFALLHPAAAGIPVTQVIGGLLFAAAVEVEKNLVVPATVHVLGNLAIFALAYVG
ncbi:MAG: CPBP family intramembrane metalloprotease [Desulfobacterales bacterium]|jgi:hypothetical protein|nr:CPBP family intramembrane metalloprotease [Desulfobacterales bacterium]